MPRITHVKAAQPRFKMIEVTDESGAAVRIETARKTRSKPGRPSRKITRRKTVPDKTQPLPPRTCEACRKPIEVGTPYKWIKPKSGPYGGAKRVRHESCPAWQPWDYSNSLSALLSKIAYDFDNAIDGATDVSEVESAQSEAADAARELAEAKREAAQNIVDGFQHETSQSDELNDTADQLEEWANEIEAVSVPDFPEPEETDCEECEGEDPECEICAGSGTYTPEEPTEGQVDEWREEVRSEFSMVSEPPV